MHSVCVRIRLASALVLLRWLSTDGYPNHADGHTLIRMRLVTGAPLQPLPKNKLDLAKAMALDLNLRALQQLPLVPWVHELEAKPLTKEELEAAGPKQATVQLLEMAKCQMLQRAGYNSSTEVVVFQLQPPSRQTRASWRCTTCFWRSRERMSPCLWPFDNTMLGKLL